MSKLNVFTLSVLAAMLMVSWAAPAPAPTAPFYGGGGGYGVGSYGGGGGHFGRNRVGANYGNHDDSAVYDKDHGSRYQNHGGLNRGVSHRNLNNFGGKNYRNRGKVDDGFHNVYHKEEFSKNNQYFDHGRDEDHNLRDGGYNDHHDEYDGGYNDDYQNQGGRRGGGYGYGGQYNDKKYDDGGDNYGYNRHGYGPGY